MSQKREYTIEQISGANAIIRRLEKLDQMLSKLEATSTLNVVTVDIRVSGGHVGRIGGGDDLLDGRSLAIEIATRARDACIAALAELGIRVAA